MDVPSGDITFLFTDIEGSTKLAQKYPGTIQVELEKHHKILTEAIKNRNGFIFEIIGDAFCAAFNNSMDAIKAARDIQIMLAKQENKEIPVKVRTGIHTGNAAWNGSKYIGYITLARTQRVMSAAYGGQILFSNDTFKSAKDDFSKNISYRDLGERRLKDLIQPVRLYQLISPELPSEFPPLKTLDARPNNLPVQVTNFIGREKEMEEVKDLLSETHLLTLAGPGGTGKTRLSLQVAAEIIDEYEYGIRFVDLAALKDDSLLMQTISRSIGINEIPNTNLLHSVLDYLKDKQILILLDNCEHIVESCSRLAEILISNCPGLRIMATSREALRCKGEVIYYVSSLELPDINSDHTLEKLTQYESVKFFIERAVSVRPGFQVNNQNAPYVAEICHKLDGIPLAIELAAARIRVLSVEQINERLSNRFTLLTSGNRTAIPRQQTLRALIDWSYDLLTDKERILWKRLSVFSGGWTIESAESVCSDDELSKDEILDVLSNLVDKSLVIHNEQSYRYTMLETIRQYGEEMLERESELDKIMISHLKYYQSLAETAKFKLVGPEQKEWIDKLDIESSNLQVALMNSIIRDRRLNGIHLALSLCRFWEMRGNVIMGINWLTELSHSQEIIPPQEKSGLVQWLGTFEWIAGNYAKAMNYYEESLAIQKELDNKTGIAIAMNNLGLIYNATGEFEKSMEITEESCELFSQLGDRRLQADALLNLGSVLINLKRYDKAKSVFEESLEIYREIGDSRSIGMILTNIGCIHSVWQEYELAREYLEESLSIQRKLKDLRSLADTVENLGVVLSFLGNDLKAQEYLEESIQLNTEIGNKKSLSNSLNSLGFVKFKVGEVRRSLYLHKESLKLRIELQDKLNMCVSLTRISEAAAENNPEKAALLLGAVETALNSFNEKLEKDLRLSFERTSDLLKKKSGEEEFSKAFNEGRSLKFEEVLEIALSV